MALARRCLAVIALGAVRLLVLLTLGDGRLYLVRVRVRVRVRGI